MVEQLNAQLMDLPEFSRGLASFSCWLPEGMGTSSTLLRGKIKWGVCDANNSVTMSCVRRWAGAMAFNEYSDSPNRDSGLFFGV